MSNVNVRREYDDGWVYNTYDDGTHQWFRTPLQEPRLFVERVEREVTRRKRWAIVDRTNRTSCRGDALYPPKISGPFPNLESAKAAYLVITSAR